MSEHKRICNIKLLWEKLYENNPMLSWFQSYAWNESLEKKFYAGRKIRYRKCTLVYEVMDESLIAPIVIDKANHTVEFLGERESSDYLSLIFDADIQADKLTKYLLLLQEKYAGYRIKFSRINQKSILCDVLKNAGFSCEERECVYVDTNTETESFYDSLSKSTRQNYRTAVNRMKKDGHTCEVYHSCDKLTEEKLEKFLGIYQSRRKYCDEVGIKSKLIGNLRRIVKKLIGETDMDVLSDYGTKEKVFFAEISIDGETAAFCIGNYNNDARVISVARVATEEKFYHYSPGVVMLVDTIQSVRDHVRFFDLTRGTEDYKFKLGGKIHKNYNFAWGENR